MNQNLWNHSYSIVDLELHSDYRGDLYEVMRFITQDIPSKGKIYVYTVNPGERRGDHYHIDKKEWFICVSGSIKSLIRTQDGLKYTHNLSCSNPQLVFVGSMTAHAVINESSDVAVLMAYASKEFDPSFPDTYPQIAD